MKHVVILGLAALTLAGCGVGERLNFRKDRVSFAGEDFRGTAKSETRDKARFTATARPASASFEGAVLMAEHQGKRHCIRYYGTSDIDWEIGPDSDPSVIPVDGDTVTLTGTCKD